MDTVTRQRLTYEAARAALGCYLVLMFTVLVGGCVALAWLAPDWSVLDLLK